MKSDLNILKTIREAISSRIISVVLAILFLNLSFAGCVKDSGSVDPSTLLPSVEFEEAGVEVTTNEDGRAMITSNIYSQGEDLDLTIKFLIQDNQGNSLKDIKILYGQLNEKVIIYVYDENNKFASAYFIGTPRELEQYFRNISKSISDDDEVLLKPSIYDPTDLPSLKNQESLIALTIVALIALASITVAEVGIILNAYKIQEFYLTDYVEETEDYILYCKTFDEIAELINSRTAIVLKTSSIFISFLTLGAGGMPVHTVEIIKEGAMWGVQELRDELLEQGIEAWGVAMDDIVNRKVAVKVYPYDEDAQFSRVKNMFAVYTIEMDNPICQENGSISGIITDAQYGLPIEDVIVKLQGEDNGTDLTNQDGEYSFNNLSNGSYTITASKSNYITEVKELDFDGGAAVVNFVLSQNLGGDQYRVVLSWGITPEDLDLHLYTENNDHIYYSNKGSVTSYPFIYLDVDDLHSYGPETITINELQASEIYVHNYSNETNIKYSQANIKVYRGNQKIREYSVPQSGSGRWWYVFDISSSGSITEKNYLLDRKEAEMIPKTGQ